MNLEELEALGADLEKVGKKSMSGRYDDIQFVKETIYSIYMSGGIDELYEHAKQKMDLGVENLKLYRMLNNISAIIENGR